ncbi:peptidase M14 [Rufibacter sp. DG15C]|uniref:M14 family metallopeptidase n=1 Tax=Rufibacter sp. DG15C TaxID=1379909 RepID=UPI00078C5162|nr:M14 metallopeptidase family protein [Rufibacter sp. DG15C]AMM52048.1 peptidase M14 [Rufibacter sp. DG15C]
MRNVLIIIFTFMTLIQAQCQTATNHVQLARTLFEEYSGYQEAAIRHRRFKHKDIVPLLEKLKQNPLFQVQVVGKSVEQRDIYLVKVGTGPNKIMLWSQMHGDEPTATMALLDIFNFLQASDELDPVREEILKENTLYIMPMLNPDGAEVYKRRNALEIDLNRDALRLQSPEARLLKALRDSIKPAFGFNLHDQSRLYTVGTTAKPATISFLAPAFDHQQTINSVRERAMRTIVGLNQAVQQFIPGQVAKYSDEHEPRAFGDNIQKWGTSLILIESGGMKGDPEKQYIRQLNFATILTALHLIGKNGYTKFDRVDYYKIPENQKNLYDVVVRNVRYKENGKNCIVDFGVIQDEISASIPQQFYHKSTVEEIGDMSVFYGYQEVDGTGLTLVPGKVLETPIQDLSELTHERLIQLLSEGYTTVKMETLPQSVNPVEQLPLNVVHVSGKVSHVLALDRMANFVLKQEDGTVRYAIVNGFVYDLQGERPRLFHGLLL